MSCKMLVEAELSRHDWDGLRELAGTATRVPDALRALLSASSPEQVTDAYWRLENHVVVQGQLFECAEAVTHVLMAALTDSNHSSFVRIGMLELLFQIVAGQPDHSEVSRGLGDLGARCKRAAQAGLWVLYRELLEGETDAAREVIALVEEDTNRLRVIERLTGKTSYAPRGMSK